MKILLTTLLTTALLLPTLTQAQMGSRGSESLDQRESLRSHRDDDRRAGQRVERLRQRLEAAARQREAVETARQALVESRARLQAASMAYAEAKAATEAEARPQASMGLVVSPAPDGRLRIDAVALGSPADSAGLRPGDRLLALDDEPLPSDGATALERVREHAVSLRAGQPVALSIEREGVSRRVGLVAQAAPAGSAPASAQDSEMTRLSAELAAALADLARADAVLADSPAAQSDLARSEQWQGLNLARVDAALGRYFGVERGVLVLTGAATPEGLEAGDVIEAVAGERVDTPREAVGRLRGFDAGQRVALELVREGSRRRVELQVPTAPAASSGGPAT